MQTLLLDQNEWDLVLDISGNIAVASEPYAIAQDVASAVRLFLGDLWYDTTAGIPYLENILGNRPSLQYIKSRVEEAALTVPTVVQARCLFAQFADRVITGQIQIIDETGATNNVTF